MVTVKKNRLAFFDLYVSWPQETEKFHLDIPSVRRQIQELQIQGGAKRMFTFEINKTSKIDIYIFLNLHVWIL